MRVICACVILVVSSVAEAQQSPEAMPVAQLISAVATKTGKKFVIDPRVQGDVTLIGQNASGVSLADLSNILQVYGFAVFEGGGYVRVVPDAMTRTLPVPMVSGNERHADAEVVSRVIKVKSMPAAHLVPLLRPVVPQNGHLVASPCTNVLLIVDSYANVRRLETIVQAMDTGPAEYQPPSCAQGEATEKR
jgi:general secretion pathway protein D